MRETGDGLAERRGLRRTHARAWLVALPAPLRTPGIYPWGGLVPGRSASTDLDRPFPASGGQTGVGHCDLPTVIIVIVPAPEHGADLSVCPCAPLQHDTTRKPQRVLHFRHGFTHIHSACLRAAFDGWMQSALSSSPRRSNSTSPAARHCLRVRAKVIGPPERPHRAGGVLHLACAAAGPPSAISRASRWNFQLLRWFVAPS